VNHPSFPVGDIVAERRLERAIAVWNGFEHVGRVDNEMLQVAGAGRRLVVWVVVSDGENLALVCLLKSAPTRRAIQVFLAGEARRAPWVRVELEDGTSRQVEWVNVRFLAQGNEVRGRQRVAPPFAVLQAVDGGLGQWGSSRPSEPSPAIAPPPLPWQLLL
jgi:hypothetical protein